MDPVLYQLGPIQIRWYSVLILVAFFLAYRLIISEAKRLNIKYDFVFNMLFWTLIFGIIGARLYYVAFNFHLYKNDLIEIFKVWNGGLAIHGGMLAGLFTILYYSRKYKVPAKRIFDIIVPGLILGQAIGRWGNFFNQEAYGKIVEYSELLDMKIIPGFVVDNMYIKGAYRLPTFYFESILCLLGFIIMLFYRRKKGRKNGQVFSFYLIWYGIVRFFIESFRSDSLMFFDFKVAQIVSVVMVIAGIIIYVIQKNKPELDELYNDTSKSVNY